jgi:hypothetical protein
MRKLAGVVAIVGIAGALAAPASAQGDPLLEACATADGTEVLYCEPPVDCAVYYENDCFPTNFEFGLEPEEEPQP